MMAFIFCAGKGCLARGLFKDPVGELRRCAVHRRSKAAAVTRKTTAFRKENHRSLMGAPGITKRKRCPAPGCSHLPSYGDPKIRHATHCAKHRLAGHINVRAPRCMAPGCGVMSSFISPGVSKSQGYCAEHRPPGYTHRGLLRKQLRGAGSGAGSGGSVEAKSSPEGAASAEAGSGGSVEGSLEPIAEAPEDVPAAVDTYLAALKDSTLFDEDLKVMLEEALLEETMSAILGGPTLEPRLLLGITGWP